MKTMLEKINISAAKAANPHPNTEAGVFWVWETRINDLQKKVNSLRRKGVKIVVEDLGRERSALWNGAAYIQRKFRVVAETVRYNNWVLEGALQPTPENAGNLWLPAPGSDYEPTKAQLEEPCSCEHCRMRRRRLTYYVITDIEGNNRTVGSTCLEQYTGGLSATAAAASLEAAMLSVCSLTVAPAEEELYDPHVLLAAAVHQGTLTPDISRKTYGKSMDMFIVNLKKTEKDRVDRFLQKPKLTIRHLESLEDILEAYWEDARRRRHTLDAFRNEQWEVTSAIRHGRLNTLFRVGGYGTVARDGRIVGDRWHITLPAGTNLEVGSIVRIKYIKDPQTIMSRNKHGKPCFPDLFDYEVVETEEVYKLILG